MEEKRFKPVEVVREKLNEMIRKCGPDADEITQKRLNFISNMLNNERCFFELKKGIAIEILSYLGFDDDEVFELYDQLTDYELLKGNFEFSSIDNQIK